MRGIRPGHGAGEPVRRLLATLVVAGAVAGAFLATGASDDGGKRSYRIVFDNSFGLVEGGDFRVGGVSAGKTKEFDVKTVKGHTPKAVVVAEINKPGFGDFREDASCGILPQSLIGEYYVDCQAGNSKRKLPTDGSGTVPVEQTTSTIPTDLVNNIMRRPYRERFRLILTELGTGLAGRPDDLQEVLRRAHPGLRETSRVLRILGDQNQVIENFIRDSDTVVQELEANKKDVARWVTEAGDAAEISATRRQDIARSFNRLPRFLDELRPTMRRLGELADEQTPLLTDLQRAAPDLDTFMSRLGPFSRASRPALRSLGRSAEAGTAAFREGSQEVEELRRLAPDARPTFKPFRQFLETMDDRRRALENDPRAKNGAPPSPDPTAIPGEGGFTGLEAIWNFIFWSGMSINGFDDVSHILRTGLTVSECSEMMTDKPEDEHLFEECSQWLGPDLPGLTTRDWTDGSSPSSRRAAAAAAERPASRVGERRGPGEPDAGPLPGQRDLSKPHVVLPPQVQELLDRLTPEQLKNLPNLQEVPRSLQQAPDDASANQLLDFLLAP
jgi:ABC-type transporter Mla subunit MlaD